MSKAADNHSENRPCPTCSPPPPRAVTDAQKLAEWEQLYGRRKVNQAGQSGDNLHVD
jgi:hypothetical protein